MSASKRLALLLVLLIAANAAPAATNGNGPESALLKAERVDGYVELGLRGRNDRRSRRGSGTSFSRNELKLDQILHLDVEGFVYYPRLLRFNAGLDLHFLQEVQRGDSLILPGGDLQLNFLESKPYGLSLFGHVSQDEVEETFGRSFESRVESYGAGFRYGLGPLPFRLRYTHRFRERSGDPTVDLVEKADEIKFSGDYRIREGSDGDVRYLFSDSIERGQKRQRHEFLLNNNTYFDSARRKRFTGVARYYAWTGRGDTSNTTVSGTYDWQHTSHLDSSYHFDYQHRKFNTQASDQYNFKSSVSHQLYGSLGSTATVFGNVQDATFGKLGEYGMGINESYTKRLGSWGRLDLGLGPFIRLQQTRPKQNTAFIVDESVVFPDANPVELRRSDIEITTIVVTSLNGATTYVEGTDYTIRSINRRTEMERIDRGGSVGIQLGEVVLVDYQYRLTGSHDLLAYGYNSNAEISYRDWGSLFANSFTQREDVVSGTANRRLEDRNRHVIGLRTRRRWFSALVSFDWDRSSFRSSTGSLQSLSLSTPWPGRWHGTVTATHRGVDFDDPSEELESWRLNANFNLRIGRSGVIEISPEYRKEDWNGGFSAEARDLEAVGGSTSIQWTFRAVEVKMGASIFRLERPALDELHDRYFLQVRRYF